MDNKRKADGEHLEDPDRDKGQSMRTEGNKLQTVEEEEESMSRNTVKYLKTLERTEAKKESEETLEEMQLAGVEVNEEEVEWRAEGETVRGRGGDLNPEQQVRQSREEEMNYMVRTLGMFEFGS